MSRTKGAGTVHYRADGRWEGRIVVGRKLDGKPIHKTVYGKTQEEVFGKLAEAKREFEQHPERASVRLTLNAFLDDYWLPAVRRGISGKTYDRYVLDVSYVRPYLGRKPLVDLTGRDILLMCSQMENSGLSNYQRFKGGKLLRQALGLAVRMELIRRNPSEDFPLPRYEKEDVNPMEPEQVRAFLDANREDRLYALYVLALDSGARQGELFALRWDDWNQAEREVSITRSIEDHKGVLREKDTKTRASRRRVVVSPKTAEVMLLHRDKMNGEAKYHQSRLLSPNVDGNWLRCSNFHRD